MLERLGVPFEVVVPEVEELRRGPPDEVVLENARRKAAAAARSAPEEATVLGVDTDVVLDGRTLGKADDEADARRRLKALSGRTHEVLSGIVLLRSASAGGAAGGRSALARSLVTFRTLDMEEIDLYVWSGEWRDRAGAYAIQGLGSILVERLEGDFSNVVGLPVRELLRLAPELLRRDAD
jgi:septum formation protein